MHLRAVFEVVADGGEDGGGTGQKPSSRLRSWLASATRCVIRSSRLPVPPRVSAATWGVQDRNQAPILFLDGDFSPKLGIRPICPQVRTPAKSVCCRLFALVLLESRLPR